MKPAFIKCLVVIILVILLYIYLDAHSNTVVYVMSPLNNKSYLVRDLPDKQQAADLMATISINLEKMVNYLAMTPPDKIFYRFKSKYRKQSGQKLDAAKKKDDEAMERHKLVNDIERLVGNFDPNTFVESTPDSHLTSYSVNKGEQIVFCLRSKKAEQSLVKQNTMMFVAIHELAHLMTESINHEPEFWDNFKFLLMIGVHLKTYTHTNFNKNPEEYCGMNITDTPLKKID